MKIKKHRKVILPSLVSMVMWACSNNTNFNAINGQLFTNNNTKSAQLSPTSIYDILLADIAKPPGLIFRYQPINQTNERVLKKALTTYERIAKKNPQDYYSIMKATEIALYLKNKDKSINNAIRFKERNTSPNKSINKTKFQANYYGLSIGLYYLHQQLTIESYNSLKNYTIDDDDLVRDMLRIISNSEELSLEKIHFIKQLIKINPEENLINLFAELTRTNYFDYYDDFKVYLKKFPQNIRINWRLSQYYRNQQNNQQEVFHLKKLTNLPQKHSDKEILARKSLFHHYIETNQFSLAKEHLRWIKNNNNLWSSWADQLLKLIIYLNNEELKQGNNLSQSEKATLFKYYIEYQKIYQLYTEKKYQEAEQNIKKLTENYNQLINTTDNDLKQDIAILYANILKKQNKTKEEIKVLIAYLKKWGDSTSIEYRLSFAYIKQKEYKKTLKTLKKLYKQNPTNAEILNSLGYILTDNFGQHEKALPLIVKANQLSPNKAHIMDSLGWVYYHLKRYGESEKILTQALKKQYDPEILSHLASALLKLGKKTQAHRLINEGLEKFPNDERLQKFNKSLNKN